jgi:D-aspartate ligase
VNQPPAILVGAGMVTAIPIIRSLGRAGVDVRLLCSRGAATSFSRYARRAPTDGNGPLAERWLRYLLGPESDDVRGGVLLACNDDGIELLLDHREELAGRFVLDICEPAAQRAMLDKLATYRVAAEAGVPTPRFWPAESAGDVESRKDDYSYPLMIKPVYAHQFKKVLAGKYLMANDFDELVAAYRLVSENGIKVVLLEVIPGPDDLLCSYYTYLDEQGEPQFHFTKRIIRRYPEREGFACYHITDWNPEVAQLGLELFRHAGLKGVANVEFKRDPRDGVLKLIECNARFTAANVLLTASGIDLGAYVYRRLAGLPQAGLDSEAYVRGMRLWYPLDDFLAFCDLRHDGRLSFGSWARGIAHRQVLPYFAWSDPLPSAMRMKPALRALAARGARRLAAQGSTGHA